VSQLVRRHVVLLAAVAVLLGACTDSSGSSTSTVTEAPAIGGSIDWQACENDIDTRCADFEVPFDYENPGVGTFTLKLVMHPAGSESSRIGSMLVNPGGPGFGGAYLAESVDSYFGEDIIDAFDIIGFDPRGTGDSTPAVDCVDDYDPYFTFDPSPDNDEEKQAIVDASQAFVDECVKRNEAILPYISTNNTARDMDRIRAALGEKKITYFGFSYGSELGATWATMFPGTVRAAVLDGATDPDSDYIEGGLDQAKGFETELTKFLAKCSAEITCEFHNNGRSEEAFDELLASLDSRPLFAEKGRVSVNQGVALTAVAQAMYSSTLWPSLEQALNAAQKGDGIQLLQMYDQYFQRQYDGTYGNELEAFNAIMCLDDPGPKSVQGVDSYIPEFKKVAPRLWSTFAAGYICAFWPTETDRRTVITGIDAGPIVVIGTTGDAATPLESSRNMAKALQDGRLIVVEENRHTGYGANQCVVDLVDSYLISAEINWTEKRC
jgi:pimeloyl-ACP methyl ester carboxylesterase